MLKVGLTGGIASGKSAVGEMFVALGAHLVQADRLAHELMNPGEPVYKQVVQHFGREIVNPDGSVNRPKLAELAFGAPDLPEDQRGSRVAELNRIVHPAVIRSQEDWMQAIGAQNRNAVAIVEAALILEAGMGKRFDRLIVVTCAPEQRTARFAARQKIDLESATKEVRRRMAAQLPDEEKVKAADYVIDNSGSLATTREQVAEVWKKLQSEASSTVS
jgi:dephospho-CoA kinase